MSEVFLIATAAVILIAMARAYLVTGDALHPMMYLGPMLLYKFVVCPAALFRSGTLSTFFPDPSSLDLVVLLHFLGIGLFCLGATYGLDRAQGLTFLGGSWHFSPHARQRMYQLGCVLGFVAAGIFYCLLFSSGGIGQVYGHSKGGVHSSSGYISEAMMLAYPAIVLMALARRGRGIGWRDLGLALLFLSPHLFAAILGTRRGPAFLVFATLGLSYCVLYLRRLPLFRLFCGLGAVGVVVLFLFAHRQQMYVGSDIHVNPEAFRHRLLPDEASAGDDFVVSAGRILMARETGTYYWGTRFVVTLFVRPIPRQLWPTKYEDLGFGWMRNRPGKGSYSNEQWKQVLGWVPAGGSAAAFVSDLFEEFSWGGLIVCYWIGRFYSYLWRQAGRKKGVWVLLYLQAATLSIYLPTQSVSAVFHRFLLMSVPTVLLWRFAIMPYLRSRRPPSGSSSPVAKGRQPRTARVGFHGQFDIQ